jgi:hypothetical protein
MNINEQPFWKDAPEASLGPLPRPLNWAIGYFSIVTQLVILRGASHPVNFHLARTHLHLSFSSHEKDAPN